MSELFLPLIFGFLICGVISAVIGTSKNRGGVASFCCGFFLGIIGIIVVALLPPGIPPAPAGMYSLTCGRCNTRQNIQQKATTYECWQCHTTHQVRPIMSAAEYQELKRKRRNEKKGT
jgi:hypothetical protein